MEQELIDLAEARGRVRYLEAVLRNLVEHVNCLLFQIDQQDGQLHPKDDRVLISNLRAAADKAEETL